MIQQFINNLKKTELYTNRRLQAGIVIAGTIIGLTMRVLSEQVRNNITLTILCMSAITIPITILAIYDGVINDDA